MRIFSKDFTGKLSTNLCILILTFGIAVGSTQGAEKVTYFHLDALGSPVAATDENGDLLWREEYKPFGEKILKEEESESNSQWYTGKPHDDELGISYFGARYYDPVVGRFLGIDAVGASAGNLHSFNRFAYASNNPYKFIDPDGNEAIVSDSIVPPKAGIGTAITAAIVAAPLAFLGGVASAIFIGKEVGSEIVSQTIGVDVPFSTKGAARTIQKVVAKSVTVSKGRFPDSAKHIEDAVASGKPNTLTIDRAGAAANRKESLRGVKTKSGLDRDEFPPAMFKEGGKGASVKHINPGDNRGAGACIGGQCRGLPDGAKVRIDVTN